ncbi:neuraminidase-like domain-containing protein [Chitinophaga sp. Hz27]|uniref:Tc toxin subunit A-related protein n=1 Tax=Chitinophaga sp. Hz27 TaxID=3347169 RepID=UPI0035E3AB15
MNIRPFLNASGSQIKAADLHLALKKLQLNIADKEISDKNIGATTLAAIKAFQEKHELPTDGQLNEKTIVKMNSELLDVFFTLNKTRTEKLQAMLAKTGITVSPEEIKTRHTGDSTRKAIEAFQRKNGLPPDGKISETLLDKLDQEVIKQTLSAKTQVAILQRSLLRARKIAKITTEIAPQEIKNKVIGPSTTAFIKAFQEKYKLPQTGILDRTTLNQINSVAASRPIPVKTLKKTIAATLTPIGVPMRLNMVTPKVNALQKSLVHLGFKIADTEFSTHTFGKTTREAVLSFQKQKGLPESGHVEGKTLKTLNEAILTANPAAESLFKYRVRGSVRDELWNRKNNMVIKVYEKLIAGEAAVPLITKKNMLNGFFDITYTPPVNKQTGQIKTNIDLVIKLYQPQDNNPANDKLLDTQICYNVSRIHWVNFTLGNDKYKGESMYPVMMNILLKSLNGQNILSIQETDKIKQVTQLSTQTGLTVDDIMRLLLSSRVAANINNPVLNPEVFFAFIRQSLPAELPGDLLRATSNWETIDALTEKTASGIVFLTDDLQKIAIENALSQNLVSRNILKNTDNIISALKSTRTTFTLQKPILIGNGSLQSLLAASPVNNQHYNFIADTFISNNGINNDFWTSLNAKAGTIGADNINSLRTVVQLGDISKNHIPSVQFLKNNIGIGRMFRNTSDIAKLDQPALAALITQNGNQVPDGIPGNTVAEKVNTYADVLKVRAESLFPAVSFVAAVKKSNVNPLKNTVGVEQFIDQQPDFDLKKETLDKYLVQNNIGLDTDTKNDIKLLLRVYKMVPDSKTGAALLDAGLHTSQQIYFAGKEKISKALALKGIDEKVAGKVYDTSKMQYTQVLSKMLQFRPEVNLGTPAVIIPQNYTMAEVKEVVGDIPDLEALFGSLDFCDCEYCKSLYGPAAYLTDILRFLKEHNSQIAGKTVLDILFNRRPDIGNILLNCANTNTALPYIDLVCEILENNISPQQINFSYQTTLTQSELRALPQYIRPQAYNLLATANYPMDSNFNLWQEEASTYLKFLRVPRYTLMENFRDISNPANLIPSDLGIAAAYFEISSFEANLIITSKPSAAEQLVYWNFNGAISSVAVTTFMQRSKLSYTEVLELLMVKYVNPTANKSEIVRPAGTCNTDVQEINNLSAAKLDRIHRFIRLWRKTGYKMWELDLLIRNPKIGNNLIDANTLSNLKRFKQLQEKSALPLENLLMFYGDINTEDRIQPDKPSVQLPSLYNRLFQNPTITNPIDSRFTLPLNGTLALGTNVISPGVNYTPIPTILSALAIRQVDIDKIIGQTDNHLSLPTLSILTRYTYLARALRLTISDLLLLMQITNVQNPFSSVQTTLDFLDNLTDIKGAGITLNELDYVLNYNPDSPVGLRDEIYLQLLGALRKGLADSVENINKLQLTPAQQNQLTSFDATSLVPLTDPQIGPAITPLLAVLTTVSDNFKNANFSVNETAFLLTFNVADITPASKAGLISNIQQLQQNLQNVINQGANQVKTLTGTSFSLTDQQATLLLLGLKINGQPGNLLSILSDETLLAKNGDTYVEINTANFPNHFSALQLLHKAALLTLKMKITTTDLQWFIDNSAAVNTINFSALPVAPSAAPNQYSAWSNICQLLLFKANYPEPEDVSLCSILDKAKVAATPKADILAEIVKLTQWSADDLNTIDSKLQLKHTALQLDYTNAEIYLRLQKCFDQIKLTGVSAAMMFSWNDRDNTTIQTDIALQTRLAVKAKFADDDWLEKITPLQDELREKKRKALVAYLLENSQRNEPTTVLFNGSTIPNPLYWKDANALFKYFLIDVEMSACQLTSRIKQAISSVQFFVQRCFLNLENRYVIVTQDEKEDTSSPNAWSQWKSWMKNYRIWEANRKVFFYPENWLEPELRDDKSSFFEELENEIMQKDVTNDNVEVAFINYLQKVNEVSHLEISGLYHEMEDLDPAEAGYEKNIVHVVGRTKAIPHVYYYRQYDMNYSSWTAWEKIEVDISGDHIVPVVYNRKLHLFWLVTQQKPVKVKKNPPAQPTTGPSDNQEPPQAWEIQLGWTILKNNGWTPKKISKQKIIHPWERPLYSYNLKPYYLAKDNELYLDIYLSTSIEFNKGLFYDQFQDKKVRVTGNDFNETYLPWHSSSFIFNGEVKDVQLKALTGYYHFEFSLDGKNYKLDDPNSSDSFEYVRSNFGEDGRNISKMAPIDFGPRLRLPNGMHYSNTHLTNNKFHAANANSLRLLQNNTSVTLLNNTLNPFELVISQQDIQFNAAVHPVFYQDPQRAFFVKPEWVSRFDAYNHYIGGNYKYRFLPFYHPYSTLFLRELNRGGIPGLLNRKVQTQPAAFPPGNTFNFNAYTPVSTSTIVDATAQSDIVDFSFGGAYSIYNWELFFHGPLLIASRLMQNQRFEEAMQWFHYIFDPSNIEALPTPKRYWITKPFFEFNDDDYRKQRIENLISNIDLPENQGQLKAWKNNPFKPHLIARYRPVAYQKNVVMKYIDNLVAWGDMLFRRDTIESINEASLLYMLAYEILGERPVKVPNVVSQDMTFNQLESKLDDLGNAAVDVAIENTLLPIQVVPSGGGGDPMPKIDTLYFAIPNNDQLLKYWDTVEDRLFKIRHCMNIEGVVRQLPLFEPPIDPALLVKAAAAGIDLGSVLNDIATGTPYYRFRIVVQKAIEFTNEVKQLGDKLLGILEKRDAEELALLRSSQEIQLLEAVKDIRKKEIDNAVQVVGSLQKVMELAEEKQQYYESREFISILEAVSVGLSGEAAVLSAQSSMGEALASSLHLIPSFSVGISGFGGSPQVTMSLGGSMFASSIQAADSALTHLGSVLTQLGSIINTMASYGRRKDEWDFQGRLAGIEKDQAQFEINSAMIKQEIAEKELENQELQIENAKAIDDYMHSKYTNSQLYNWMITQISTIYFQAYRLAFDMAKKAEKCYQYELGFTNTSFIQFGYWDSLKKGLLSGDILMNDLRRMEAAYIDNNKRELEITKHLSLMQLSPLSLMTLKETGKCTLILPELLFDMDYPGHYMRRIKSLSVSIPCVAGPYTSINCTLSLIKSEIRRDATLTGNVYAKIDENDTRFSTQLGAITSIATSHAQNDSGLFELNFNDDRYLPFEGLGVISEWQIELPRENNYFDFASLADVILHMNYTARSGGGQLAIKAREYLQASLPNMAVRLFSLKRDFGTEWYRFLHPEGTADQELVITLKPDHFPFFIRNKLNTLKLTHLDIFIESKETADFSFNLKITSADLLTAQPIAIDPTFNNVYHCTMDLSIIAGGAPNCLGELRLKLKLSAATDFKALLDSQVDDIFFLFQLGS